MTISFQPSDNLQACLCTGCSSGGLVGTGIRLAMQYGIARGAFSNESGMGSAPIAAAAALRQKSGSPGTGIFNRYFLGYRSCMSDDRAGACIYRMKNPNINADQISDGGTLTTLAFGQIPVFGPYHLNTRNHLLCIFYDSRMGLLRRTCGRIFLQAIKD